MCAWKFFFGFDCPGCGLTHAMLACLRGDILESVALHPMGVMVFLWVANVVWLRKIYLSATALKGVSFSILFGFFVPWVFKFFV